MADEPSPVWGENSVEELYEHAPCGYLSTDAAGTIVRVNATLLDWLGYDRADLVGRRTFQSLLTVGGQIYYETHYDPLLRMQGTVREIAVDLVRRDGSRLPALVNSDVWSAGPDTPKVVRTTVFGATFRRRYETELLAARRAAEHSSEQLALVQELVSDFAAAVTRADVVAVLVGKGARVAGATDSSVWLCTADGTALEWAGGTAMPTDPRSLYTPLSADGSAPHAWAAHETEPVLRAPPGANAVLFVQLVAADGVLGVAAFGYPAGDAVDADTRQLLRTVGRQAGQTLQRTGLFEAEQRLRVRAETLQLITAALAAPLDARQIAEAAAVRLAATLDFDRILVVLAGDPDPEVVVARGFAPDVVQEWRRRPAALAPALAGPADDGAFFSSLDDAPVPGLAGPGVLAVLPLHAGVGVLGCLVLGRRAGGFPAGERGFLHMVAGQCAQALERARLAAAAAERQREAAFLVALSRRLDETPGLRRRATALVSGLVPAVAARARLDLVLDGQLTRLAAAPDGPQAPEPPESPVTPTAHVAAALATGEAGWAGDEVALPLRARGRVIGVLVLGTGDAGTGHAGGTGGGDAGTGGGIGIDVAGPGARFLAELSEAAGLALENGRLYDQEHRNAHILQQGLLAGEPPQDPRVAIATWYRPATSDLEVGGDWHDAFLVGPDLLAVVVGDVVGRGIRAAATMGHLRSAVRALAATDPGPASVLDRLDRFVDRFEDGRMSTVAYGVLDLVTGRLRYACAGHVPPLLIEPDGNSRFLWAGRSAPIAAYAGMKARVDAEVGLAPGGRLLLYTDGLVERRTGNFHNDLVRLAGEASDRFRTPLARLLPDLGGVLAGGSDRDDDVCMLCVAFGQAPQFRGAAPADAAWLKSLRDDLRTWLGGTDLTQLDREALVLACAATAAGSR